MSRFFPSYEEIAQDPEINSSRQYVRQTCIGAMGKVFKNAQRLERDLKPHEIFIELTKMFSIPDGAIEEFYKGFPTKIQEKISTSLRSSINEKSQ